MWRFAAICALVCALGVAADFNPYSVLGLHRSASASEVKKQFRRLSRENHPDVSQGAEAKERYADILRAYSILSDSKKRSQYDQYGVLDDDRQPRPPGSPFNFFNQRRQKLRPIESSTRTLSLADFVIDFRGYRGRRLRLLQVYSDQSPECHMFAPAWESLAKSSAIRHQADFARIDFGDQHLVELSELSISQLPAIFVFINGEAYPVRDFRITSSVTPVVAHFERTVQGYLSSFVDNARRLAVGSVADLHHMVSERRFHKPFALVNSDDPLFAQVVMSLSSVGDAVDVYAAPAGVLSTASSGCPAARFRTTSVWLFNAHTDDLCAANRFPSGRLDDEDGIIRFVSKRVAKPMPTLTNHSVAPLCVDEAPCVVDLRTASNRDLPPLSDALTGALRGFKLTSADAEFAPALKKLASFQPDTYTIVLLSERGYVSTSGGEARIRQFIQDVAAGRVPSSPLPRGWALDAGALEYSPWKRMLRFVDDVYNTVPLANVAMLVVLWLAFTGCRAFSHHGDGARQGNEAGSAQSGGRAGSGPKPQDRGERPQRTHQQTPPQAKPDPPKRAANAGANTFPEAHRRASSVEHESPKTASATAGSRSYPGAGGSYETTRRSIRGLAPADISECGASRVLLVLLFSPGEGIKAPADSARLLQYPDVRMRAVPRKMPRWWDWAHTNAPDALRQAMRDKTPLIVAVRPRKNTAAVKPAERSMTMWVDALMEGALPMALPAQAEWLSVVVN